MKEVTKLYNLTNRLNAENYNATPAAFSLFQEWQRVNVERDGRNNPLVRLPQWARGHNVVVKLVFADPRYRFAFSILREVSAAETSVARVKCFGYYKEDDSKIVAAYIRLDISDKAIYQLLTK